MTYEKAQQSLQAKKAQVEAAIKANDQHAAERNTKLASLHPPGKVVEETNGSHAASGSTAA